MEMQGWLLSFYFVLFLFSFVFVAIVVFLFVCFSEFHSLGMRQHWSNLRALATRIIEITDFKNTEIDRYIDV